MTVPITILGVLLTIILTGCMPPADPGELTPPALSTGSPMPHITALPGTLSVEAGSDRVASAGEEFFLSAQATGGVYPYTFTWRTCTVAQGCMAPIIQGADGAVAGITVFGTCRLRVTITDAEGGIASDEIQITVPKLATY